MIIFFSSRKLTELVAIELTKRLGVSVCRYYHAKLKKTERSSTEKWFFDSNDGILFATSAYGMGVDKKNVRCVIHYSLSSDVASFLQESGRGGRDGKPTLSVTLLGIGEKLLADESFTSIFTTSVHCRRLQMLQLMDSPLDHCSGCDVCDNSYIPSPLGEKQIVKAVWLTPLRFTGVSLAHHLVATPYKPTYRTSPYYGVLKNWGYEEVLKAIQSLIKNGKITVGYKERIYIPIRVRNNILLVKKRAKRLIS